MKKLLLVALIPVVLGACNFDKEHNKQHIQEWDKGFDEFHELFDYFVLTPR